MTRRIRILHILPWIGSGGVERRRLQLVRGLDPSRYEQKIVCFSARGPLAEELEPLVEIHRLGGRAAVHPLTLIPLLKFILEYQPHIVHGAVFEGCTMAVLAGRLARVPIVIVEETSEAANRRPRGHLLMRSLALASDRCVAISPAVARMLEQVSGVPKSRVAVVANGVEAPKITESRSSIRASLRITEEELLVGSVGRMLDDHKRFSDQIRSMVDIARVLPNARLLLVGDGPDRAKLESLARELGMHERVVFAGHRHDVGNIYAALDVFCLSSAREGFGLVIAEAMHCGLPVVATRVGGIVDVVVDGETGVLVPPRDPAALARALCELLRDSARAKKMGQAGKERAARDFSAARYLRDVDQLYCSLASEKLSI